MMIRTRLSIAVIAATLSLVGCVGDDEDQQVVTESYVGFDPVVASADNANLPANQQRGPVIPFPFDALFAGAKTPTLNIPNSGNVPFVANANMQDGFSTTASWFIDIFGLVDMTTVQTNLVIVEKTATPRVLVYGVDYTLQSSTVKDSSGIPISAQRTRLLIEPLKPLMPSTTYVVALKKGVKTTNGGMVQPSYMFNLLNSDTKISDSSDSYLTRFSAAEKANLEALQLRAIRPVVLGLAPLGITNVLLAYTITTQSTTKTLDMVAAATMAGDIAANKTPFTAQALLPATVPNADQTDVYVGTLKVPYYGDIPSATKPTATLSSFWKADVTKPDAAAGFLGTAGACSAYVEKLVVNGIQLEPSVSTTACFPMPVKQSDQTIPMLVTVPKGVKPPNGWPVVIFQHGITRNRADMLAIAPALASAQFVTVAIDLPLHGIAPTDAAKGLRISGVSERTFDVDFVNNTTNAPGQDTVVDGSGTHFINLASPITSRDNLRQGAADILVLAKSLPNLNLDGVAGGDIDASKIRFVGISLGSIVGTVALGADKGKTIGAASLSVGGGAIPKLLDASKSYGPIITAGLAASGIAENTDSYETFMRFAQTLTDSGDPINFAVAAKTNHPIHLTEVVGDLVVPNSAMAGAASATQDFVGISAFLSGTEALARVMGVDQTMAALDVAGITASQQINPTGLGVLVKFKQGSHGSLIDPSSNLAVTQEMQRQTVNFIVSNGVCLPIGQNCSF